MCPSSSCSSPVFQKIVPSWPRIARGEIGPWAKSKRSYGEEERHLVDRGPADAFHHEREARSARRGRGSNAGEGRARRHRDGRDLVLRLDDEDGPRRGVRAVLFPHLDELVLLEELALIGGG